VAELVDALDSKSSFFGSAGSIPALSTIKNLNKLITSDLRFYYFIICTIIVLLKCFNVFFAKNKVVF
jgi:hypothetical protein